MKQNPAQAQRRIREGWQFIAVLSDAGFLLSKAAETGQALGLCHGQAAVKY